MMRYTTFIVLIGCIFLTACQTDPAQNDPIPALAPKDESAALVILQKRAADVHSLSAKCQMKFISADGKATHLDGSIVLTPPDRLQLIGTSNNQIVLSVTFRPDGLWTQAGTSANPQAIPPGLVDALRLILWTSGNYFNEQSLAGATVPSPNKPPEFEYDVPLGAGSAVVCEVETKTVTPRKYTLLDESAVARLSIELSEYRQFGEIVWPTRMVASGKEISTIDFALNDVKINGQLDQHAFDPPAGAVKQ
jgi:hypothetical protein